MLPLAYTKAQVKTKRELIAKSGPPFTFLRTRDGDKWTKVANDAIVLVRNYKNIKRSEMLQMMLMNFTEEEKAANANPPVGRLMDRMFDKEDLKGASYPANSTLDSLTRTNLDNDESPTNPFFWAAPTAPFLIEKRFKNLGVSLSNEAVGTGDDDDAPDPDNTEVKVREEKIPHTESLVNADLSNPFASSAPAGPSTSQGIGRAEENLFASNEPRIDSVSRRKRLMNSYDGDDDARALMKLPKSTRMIRGMMRPMENLILTDLGTINTNLSSFGPVNRFQLAVRQGDLVFRPRDKNTCHVIPAKGWGDRFYGIAAAARGVNIPGEKITFPIAMGGALSTYNRAGVPIAPFESFTASIEDARAEVIDNMDRTVGSLKADCCKGYIQSLGWSPTNTQLDAIVYY